MKAKFNLSVIIILRRIINYHCFVDVLLKYSLWVLACFSVILK